MNVEGWDIERVSIFDIICLGVISVGSYQPAFMGSRVSGRFPRTASLLPHDGTLWRNDMTKDVFFIQDFLERCLGSFPMKTTS